jgi:glutaminase
MADVRPVVGHGHLPQYVPALAQVQPDVLALAVQVVDRPPLLLGDADRGFTLMSMMKPFLLLFALETAGYDAVFGQVGSLPSDQSFHSLKQLAADRGKPRNPMLNSGAIGLVDFLPGDSGDVRCERFRQWLGQKAGIEIVLDQAVLASVRSLPNDTNRAISQMLKNAGIIRQMDIALDTYNQLCCLSVTVATLAQLGLLLAVPNAAVARQSQQVVNALMLTCGMYESSGEWAVRIGLPIKSGVSGGILAIVPQQGAIAIYSPTIDDVGNSVAGTCLLEQITQQLDLSVF